MLNWRRRGGDNMVDPTPVQAVEADPKKPYKAYVAGAVTGIVAFIAFWVGDDDPFTKKDAGEAFLAGVISAAPSFGLSFVVPNPLRRKQP